MQEKEGVNAANAVWVARQDSGREAGRGGKTGEIRIKSLDRRIGPHKC